MPRKQLPSDFPRRLVISALAVLGVFLSVSASMTLYSNYRAAKIQEEPLLAETMPLSYLSSKLDAPAPGSWRSEQFEIGQTIEEFSEDLSQLSRSENKVIEIIPVGDFREDQAELIRLTAEYVEAYLCLPVRVEKQVSRKALEQMGGARIRGVGQVQYHTESIARGVLRGKVRDDVFQTLILTGEDLYPRESWNFVFGEAFPHLHAGIWSFARFEERGQDDKGKVLRLRRTLKTATHETLHLFGISHCISFLCNLNGSMDLEEADAAPLELCPHCLSKLFLAVHCDPQLRAEKLARFAEAHGLLNDAALFREEAFALSRANKMQTAGG